MSTSWYVPHSAKLAKTSLLLELFGGGVQGARNTRTGVLIADRYDWGRSRSWKSVKNYRIWVFSCRLESRWRTSNRGMRSLDLCFLLSPESRKCALSHKSLQEFILMLVLCGGENKNRNLFLILSPSKSMSKLSVGLRKVALTRPSQRWCCPKCAPGNASPWNAPWRKNWVNAA